MQNNLMDVIDDGLVTCFAIYVGMYCDTAETMKKYWINIG